MFTFANTLAEGLEATHPQKSLLMLAYGVYRAPPRQVKIHPKLVVQYCDNAEFHWDPKQKAYRVGMLERWAELTPNIDIYEYYNWSGYHPGRAFVPLISESIKRFHRLGIRMFRIGMGEDFGRSGLNIYVAAKLLWDPRRDTGEIVGDYCAKAFGEGASIMRRYFRRLDEKWKEAVEKVGGRTEDITPMHPSFYLISYSPATRAELKQLIQQAENAAQTEAQKARVRLFGQALRYAELTVMGVEKILELERNDVVELQKATGISFSLTQIVKFAAPSSLPAARHEKARSLVKETIRQWEERERFMDDIAGQCVLDVRSARSGEVRYRFNPFARLREIEAAYEGKAAGNAKP